MDVTSIPWSWPLWIQREILSRLNLESWNEIPSLNPSKTHYWQTIINQYDRGIPITKIIGIKYFYDYKLINYEALDPRYDSEVIFDIFAHWDGVNYRPKTAIELGGGTGCLSIAMIKHFNNLMTIGELNGTTIKTLQRNLKINGVEAQVVETNWWQNVMGKFDVLITNPPYLSLSEMINGSPWETYGDPPMALYGGLDGLDDYRTILKDAHKFINHWIILEICSNKLKEIISLMGPHWSLEKIFYDLQNRPRMLLLTKINYY